MKVFVKKDDVKDVRAIEDRINKVRTRVEQCTNPELKARLMDREIKIAKMQLEILDMSSLRDAINIIHDTDKYTEMEVVL